MSWLVEFPANVILHVCQTSLQIVTNIGTPWADGVYGGKGVVAAIFFPFSNFLPSLLGDPPLASVF